MALAADVAAVVASGLPIVSLRDIALALASPGEHELPERFVAFSCDDGTLLDWAHYQHPEFGEQRSFASIFRELLPQESRLRGGLLTAFVIACPRARAAIDAGCYNGIPLSDDNWWAEAAREGLVAIESHGWDHVHPVLPDALQQYGRAGDFFSVDSYPRAQQQIAAAKQVIDEVLATTGHTTRLFAYPYGHVSPYLLNEYLPQNAGELSLLGAFSTEPRFVESGCNPFAIPRLVHGDAWTTREQFAALMHKLESE